MKADAGGRVAPLILILFSDFRLLTSGLGNSFPVFILGSTIGVNGG
jgi:hypothetical protein